MCAYYVVQNIVVAIDDNTHGNDNALYHLVAKEVIDRVPDKVMVFFPLNS
jgi:hypothetical protein